MSEFFSSDGPFIGCIQKIGTLILLGILFLVCSLPVITIGTAASALYYAVAKSVRRGRGYPVREFFRAFRRNLGKGILLTVLLGGIAALLLYNRELLQEASAKGSGMLSGMNAGGTGGGVLTLYVIYDGLLILLAMLGVYLFPVLSRFAMRLGDIIKLSFVMSVRFIYYTVPLIAGLGILFILQYKILPIPMAVLLPGGWTYLSSFMIEKAMKKYTPAPKDGEDAWYLE